MLDKSLFKTTEVVAKELEFPDGKATLYFRTLTSAESGVLYDTLHFKNFTERADSLAWVIQQSLCNKDGSQKNDDGTAVITVDQVKQLKAEPFQLILNAVFEINKPKLGK